MDSTGYFGPQNHAAKKVLGRRSARVSLSLLLCAFAWLSPGLGRAQDEAESAPKTRTKPARKRVTPATPRTPRAAKPRKGTKPAPVTPPAAPDTGPLVDDPFVTSDPATPVADPPAATATTPALPPPLPVATPGSPYDGPSTSGPLSLDAPTTPPPADASAGSVPLPPAQPLSNNNVPDRAPFTEPSPDRAMPPPSGLAGLDGPDPLAVDALEESVSRVLSEAVVTTASKRRQRIADVPLTVSWIPAEELEGTGQFSLCEAIQYFPGMECRRGSMRKAAVSARGLGSNYLSNRLLLLKDGRPLTDPWTGQFYADETTPMTNLKQVEVIRGPGSSLYGSNAFSGVINIIERQPSDLIPKGQNMGADARVLAGQDKTWRLQSTVAGRGGPVEALLGYYGFGSDGPQLFNDPRVGQVDDNEDSLVHQVNGKVRVGPLALDADFTDANIGRPGGQNISTVGNCGRCHYTAQDNEHVQNLNTSIQVDQQLNDKVRVFAQGYAFFKRRDVALENQVTGALESALGKRRRLGGEARAHFSLDRLSLTVGGDVKADQVNNQNILSGLGLDDTKQTILGGFVDAEYRITDRLVVGAGARYDRYQIPERVWTARSDQVSPRASVVFHAIPELLTLRTNYGRAFRAPTLAELAINQQMYAATLLGNPGLRAETLDTVEAAVDFWPLERKVRLTGTAFFNRANNFINQELLFGSTSQFKNLGDARVAGFEAEAAAQVPALNSSFDVAYQFLDARALPADGGPDYTLDYAPSHRIYARGRTNIGKVAFVEIYGLFVGPRFDPGFVVDELTGTTQRVRLPSYITASARVGFQVHERVAVSLLGTNLFNASYEESHGFPAPPQGLFTEIRLRY
ncbi:TonB-dependent receptor [Corallococcus sp. BB11-1]|uniref:TonB-dependent receptor plug domain-containing protein n=1 Tax=Corallococcus sp. BB11-1 TaxID=2996783 RepID=UPI00226F0F96|nr:TonB-dependent receptor [Corallococcus sp. BB11-1]MCY1030749.1 TonB-dependent receptor [Corallococcus sp. BB11-1]